MHRYERVAIEKFGNNYRRNKDTEFIFRCPKCNHNKLYVNTTNGLYHCFRCDYKGVLKARVSLQDVKNKQDITALNQIVKKDNNELTLVYFESLNLTDAQKTALKNRGLTDTDIRYYNICGRSKDNRIQIPNFVKGCFTDVLCAWQYDKSKVNKYSPKYLNSEGTKKSETLFNIYNIESNINQIIICEGIFNAITAGKNAVASYGCNISDKQIQLIIDKKPKSILIAYDSDQPGVEGSLKVIDKLKAINYNGVVEYVLLPNGIDINDLGHDNFINYLNNNKVYIDLNNPVSLKLPKLLFESRTN